MDQFKFPVGQFEPQPNFTSEERAGAIGEISEIARSLRRILAELGPERLQIPYRPGGWTARQIVHHMADNDMNAYLRFKRALTEEEPMSSTYREDLWAELSEYSELPVENSLLLLEILHTRFVVLLHGLHEDDFRRRMRTRVLGSVTLDVALQRFLWHNRHHTAQIESLITARGG